MMPPRKYKPNLPNDQLLIAEIKGDFNKIVYADDQFEISQKLWVYFLYGNDFYPALSSPFYFEDVWNYHKVSITKSHTRQGNVRLFAMYSDKIIQPLDFQFTLLDKALSKSNLFNLLIQFQYVIYNPKLLLKKLFRPEKDLIDVKFIQDFENMTLNNLSQASLLKLYQQQPDKQNVDLSLLQPLLVDDLNFRLAQLGIRIKKLSI
jgi:hypothetical protein